MRNKKITGIVGNKGMHMNLKCKQLLEDKLKAFEDSSRHMPTINSFIKNLFIYYIF